MNRIILIILTFLFPIFSIAQEEASYWYFGNNAGIDFISETPGAVLDGKNISPEGVSTLSDLNGNLIMYTNGETVWDSTHNIMQNGENLAGNINSTQSSIIIKQPGENRNYYIFTTNSLEGSWNGLSYSVVDLSLNNGLGAVTAKKNIEIMDFDISTEKITAIQRFETDSIWIITHEFNSNRYYSFLLDSVGITDTVISIGNRFLGNPLDKRGYIKASSDGNKIATAFYQSNLIELLEFNADSGKVNPLSIDTDIHRPYGLEFSDDNMMLYATTTADHENLDATYELVQYDICNPANMAINKDTIYQTTDTLGALQITPEYEILVARNNKSYLGNIQKPNEFGVNVNYQHDGYSLNNRTSTLGLPTFLQTDFYIIPYFTVTNQCVRDSSKFKMHVNVPADSVFWDFGDPSTGEYNFSNDTAPEHMFSSSTSFIVLMVLYRCDKVDTIKQRVDVSPNPSPALGGNKTICEGDEITLKPTDGPYYNHVWNTGENKSEITVSDAGKYYVDAETSLLSSKSCNTVSDTITVEVIEKPDVSLPPNFMLCRGTERLDVKWPNAKYKWSNGSTSSFIEVNGSRLNQDYSVTVSVGNCVVSDNITIYWCPKAIIGVPNAFSPNNDGKHDKLFVEGQGFESFNFMVFNRFGNIVFQSTDSEIGWDGTYKGKECEIDTYIWRLEVTYFKGHSETLHGNVTLLR